MASQYQYTEQEALNLLAGTTRLSEQQTLNGILSAGGLANAFNVAVFGAQGDGTTDDTAALNNALSTASTAGGGTVYLRAATYKINGVVNLQSNVELRGESTGVTLKLGSGAAIKCSSKTNVKIRDVSVDGSSQVTNNYGILIQDSSYVLVSGVSLASMTGFGIFISATSSNTCKNVGVHNCYIYGQGNNDVIGGGPGNSTGAVVSDVIVSGNHVYQDCTTNNYENAFDIVKVKGIKVIGNHFYGKVQFGTEQFPNTSSDFIGNTIHPAINKTSTSILITTYGSATSNNANLVVNSNNIDSGQIKISGISGQLVNQPVIIGNSVKCVSAANGIDLSYCTNGVVAGNSIQTAAAGVGIANSTQFWIGGNYFDSCVNAVNESSATSSVIIGQNGYSNISSTVYVGGSQGMLFPKQTTSSADGFSWGGDTTLYRQASSSLKTDGKLIVGSQLGVLTNSPNSTAHVNGSFATAIGSKTSTFTPSISENTFLVDATSGAVTANLPDATNLNGREYWFKKVDASANTVTIDGFGTQTIDGSLTKVLSAQYATTHLKTDGSNWYVL